MNDSNNINKVLAKPNFAFLRGLNLDQDVTKRLTYDLLRTVEGNDQVFLTPLGKDNNPLDLLKAWDEIVLSNKHRLNEALIELESSNRDKFGPRSIALPWKSRKDNLSSYFDEDKCRIPFRYLLPPNLKGKGSLRLLEVKNAAKYLKTNTSSGLPFLKKKRYIRDRLIDKFEYYLQRKDPCVLFTRTQENLKTRNVWGFPVADTLNEMRCYVPLLSYQKRLNWRSALTGPDEIDFALTRIIDTANSTGQLIISLDAKAYDSSLRSKLQEASFGYIKSLFQPSCSSDIDYMAERFKSIGIVTPDGVFTGPHGVPSGSTFTNEVDSIAQYLVANSSSCITEGLYNIQGDDGIYAIEKSNLDLFLSTFNDAGIELNQEPKTKISDEYGIYLQNLYHPEYRVNGLVRGVYPTYRALCRLIYQERWSDFEEADLKGQDYYSLRAITILENCKYHPLFKDLVQFIKSIDKYSLRVTRGSVDKYADFIKQSTGSGDLFNNHYGDDARGIRSFHTWKLIYK